MSNYSGGLVPILGCCCVVCVDRFELIKVESDNEMVESAMGMITMLDDFRARGLVRQLVGSVVALKVNLDWNPPVDDYLDSTLPEG